MKKVGFLVVLLVLAAFAPLVNAYIVEELVYTYTTNQTTVYIGDLHPSDGFFASARGNVFSLAETVGIGKVEVEMQRVGSPTADLFAVIYASSGGKPTGSALATSDAINTATISTSWGTKYNFTFSTPYEVTASTTYCYLIQAGTTGTLDAGSDHYVNFYGAYGNSAGTSYAFGSWSANSNPLVMRVFAMGSTDYMDVTYEIGGGGSLVVNGEYTTNGTVTIEKTTLNLTLLAHPNVNYAFGSYWINGSFLEMNNPLNYSTSEDYTTIAVTFDQVAEAGTNPLLIVGFVTLLGVALILTVITILKRGRFSAVWSTLAMVFWFVLAIVNPMVFVDIPAFQFLSWLWLAIAVIVEILGIAFTFSDVVNNRGDSDFVV